MRQIAIKDRSLPSDALTTWADILTAKLVSGNHSNGLYFMTLEQLRQDELERRRQDGEQREVDRDGVQGERNVGDS